MKTLFLVLGCLMFICQNIYCSDDKKAYSDPNSNPQQNEGSKGIRGIKFVQVPLNKALRQQKILPTNLKGSLRRQREVFKQKRSPTPRQEESKIIKSKKIIADSKSPYEFPSLCHYYALQGVFPSFCKKEAVHFAPFDISQYVPESKQTTTVQEKICMFYIIRGYLPSFCREVFPTTSSPEADKTHSNPSLPDVQIDQPVVESRVAKREEETNQPDANPGGVFVEPSNGQNGGNSHLQQTLSPNVPSHSTATAEETKLSPNSNKHQLGIVATHHNQAPHAANPGFSNQLSHQNYPYHISSQQQTHHYPANQQPFNTHQGTQNLNNQHVNGQFVNTQIPNNQVFQPSNNQGANSPTSNIHFPNNVHHPNHQNAQFVNPQTAHVNNQILNQQYQQQHYEQYQGNPNLFNFKPSIHAPGSQTIPYVPVDNYPSVGPFPGKPIISNGYPYPAQFPQTFSQGTIAAEPIGTAFTPATIASPFQPTAFIGGSQGFGGGGVFLHPRDASEGKETEPKIDANTDLEGKKGSSLRKKPSIGGAAVTGLAAGATLALLGNAVQNFGSNSNNNNNQYNQYPQQPGYGSRPPYIYHNNGRPYSPGFSSSPYHPAYISPFPGPLYPAGSPGSRPYYFGPYVRQHNTGEVSTDEDGSSIEENLNIIDVEEEQEASNVKHNLPHIRPQKVNNARPITNIYSLPNSASYSSGSLTPFKVPYVFPIYVPFQKPYYPLFHPQFLTYNKPLLHYRPLPYQVYPYADSIIGYPIAKEEAIQGKSTNIVEEDPANIVDDGVKANGDLQEEAVANEDERRTYLENEYSGNEISVGKIHLPSRDETTTLKPEDESVPLDDEASNTETVTDLPEVTTTTGTANKEKVVEVPSTVDAFTEEAEERQTNSELITKRLEVDGEVKNRHKRNVVIVPELDPVPPPITPIEYPEIINTPYGYYALARDKGDGPKKGHVLAAAALGAIAGQVITNHFINKPKPGNNYPSQPPPHTYPHYPPQHAGGYYPTFSQQPPAHYYPNFQPTFVHSTQPQSNVHYQSYQPSSTSGITYTSSSTTSFSPGGGSTFGTYQSPYQSFPYGKQNDDQAVQYILI